MIVAAIIAHLGSAAALLIALGAALRPALANAPHPEHALALEPGLGRLLAAYALTPRLTALPMAIVARRASASRWYTAGFAVLAAESVLRASAVLVTRAVTPAVTPAEWVSRLRPPAHVLTAILVLSAAGCCWAMALAESRAVARGSANGPDAWDIQDAGATMWWTAALSLGVAHAIAPLAVAFVLRLG